MNSPATVRAIEFSSLISPRGKVPSSKPRAHRLLDRNDISSASEQQGGSEYPLPNRKREGNLSLRVHHIVPLNATPVSFSRYLERRSN